MRAGVEAGAGGGGSEARSLLFWRCAAFAICLDYEGMRYIV
jgi:hypothetical protein